LLSAHVYLIEEMYIYGYFSWGRYDKEFGSCYLGIDRYRFFFVCKTQSSNEAKQTYKNISAEELKQRFEKWENLFLLDVRTPEEFSGPFGFLEGAILIPVQELESRIDELQEYKEKEIVVYCRSGNRSRTAVEILAARKFKVFNLEGGMIAWNAMSK